MTLLDKLKILKGEVVGLDDKTHQAELKYINEKEESKVVKMGYLKLVKNLNKMKNEYISGQNLNEFCILIT
jgi:hypothetical protein